VRAPTKSIVLPILGAGLLLMLLGSATSTAAAAGPTTQSLQTLGPVEVGKQLPSWAGHTASGQMVRSSDILQPRRGEAPDALVISFFGTWCEPCRTGLRVIQSVMDEHQGYKTVLIAKPPDLQKVRSFLKGLGVNQQVIPDEHQAISKRLGVGDAVPRTIVVGSDGVVRAIFGEEGGDFKQVLIKALGAEGTALSQ
jgi:peroxiredoxin